MRIQLEGIKNIGRRISLNDDKGYVVAIVLALVIISSLLAGYYLLLRPAPSGYSTIYVLDSHNNAVDYPQLLIANQNSTFNVPVTVINNMGSTTQYEVLIKITNNPATPPVNTQPSATYQMTLKNGQSWQKTATITENQVGNYSVVFELWRYNSDPNVMAYQFTYDYCKLPIQVVS